MAEVSLLNVRWLASPQSFYMSTLQPIRKHPILVSIPINYYLFIKDSDFAATPFKNPLS